MKVLIGTPAYGGQVTVPYMSGIIGLINSANAKGVQMDIFTLANESLITRGRNEIVGRFLENGYTHLLWIDADIAFTPDDAWRLLESGHDVCAKPYAMKGLNWEAMAKVEPTEEALRAASFLSVANGPVGQPVDDWLPVMDAGTGFMCVTREAIEKLIAAHPETHYLSNVPATRGANRWALFDCIIRDGTYLSEDYTFCYRWRDQGGTVYADISAPRLGHQGSYIFGK